MSQPPSTIKIVPITYADFLPLQHMGEAACVGDRQTQLKKLGNISYLVPGHQASKYKDFVEALQNPKHISIKAIDSTTGEAVGSLRFVFHGFEPAELPEVPDRGDKSSIKAQMESFVADDVRIRQELQKQGVSDTQKRRNTMIDRFEAMENADFDSWQSLIMQPSTRCLIIAGFFVSPAHQHQGIGSSLLKYATDLADRHKVFMWVHSSEAAFRAYEKAGFVVSRTLDVDLDEWAAEPPPKSGKWGHYVIRYMRREVGGGERVEGSGT